MINIVYGSILDAKEKYIAHQCNCVTTHAAGVAKAIFDKFPYSDVYKDRTTLDELGTIKIMGNGIEDRFIINMFAQYLPGHSKIPDHPTDGLIARQRHFYSCLVKIAKIPDLESIAFPYGIGCSMGGGNWTYYSGFLGHFAKYVNDKFGTKVVLYNKGD
jgi:O-acetyl-ADP-ribose deacetylase (regulator of RNase III)